MTAPPNAIDLLHGMNHAEAIVKDMHAAYWVRASGNADTSEFLWRAVHAQFLELAADLGYSVQRLDAPAEPEVTRVLAETAE